MHKMLILCMAKLSQITSGFVLKVTFTKVILI